jgi:hypothetical protein
MDFSMRDRVDAQMYIHIGHSSKELVFGVGNAQGDDMVGRFDLEVQIHIHIKK